ncbi:MAG: Asp-tRNA(Asn)/Glu-tRNA(Gln) amidotransferase subunit GatB [Tissierellia bacterium]|nr:Asp-tRNA(Asn)/Glu-tRNA(Gln) amidotransferase subunit GatB [Tissierellia bacterium]
MKTIIGLEIHVELATDTKMFCSCKNEFGQAPNTVVCPVCLGHVGTLPRINKKAVEYAVKAGLAFDCDIRTNMKFDRKKYYYPDLTKGYQITQQDEPIATDGYLEVDSEDGVKKVRIERIHLEEDTGKSTHTDDGHTLLDYNRAGVPLIEIVSKPDMSSAEEARQFLENLRQRLKFIGVSDVKMEEGSLRCDVNINIKDDEGNRTGIAEIKNLNSFRAVVRAIEFEEKRQAKMLEEKEIGTKETRRWDDASQSTILMRKKDDENDYRFTVDSDLPRVVLEDEFIQNIKDNLPELPNAKRRRYKDEYALSDYDANVLSQSKEIADLFEQTLDSIHDPQLVANWIQTEVMRRLKEYEIDASEMKLSIENFAKLLKLVKDDKISNNVGKKVLRDIFDTNEDPEKLVEERGLIQISDTSFLDGLVKETLDENPQSIEDYKAGKDRALGFLMGQIMKKSKGKANPQQVNSILKEELDKR